MTDQQRLGTPHAAGCDLRSGLSGWVLWSVRVPVAWMLILAAPLHACPICDTGTGQQVRAGIFDENFWGTLIAVIAPFPVLILVIAAYHFGFPGRWNRSGPANETNPASTHNEHHES